MYFYFVIAKVHDNTDREAVPDKFPLDTLDKEPEK